MRKSLPRIIIAGLRGGSGKTTLSLGLITALAGAGRTIVPFKKGPDYIDAGWLSAAAGRPCYNLDPFLIGRESILSSFRDHFGDADCAVIEGNRGLYDGMDAAGTYSTAELAKMLRAPVLLVLDCSKVTRTAAAMVCGMQQFDKGVALRGVVLNRIAGARHEKIIREAIETYCGVPVVGAIPKLDKEFLSERHMGLTPFQEHPEVAKALSFAAEAVRGYVDVDRVYEIARSAGPFKAAKAVTTAEAAVRRGRGPRPSSGAAVRIGVIRDTAFQFYYPENFEELRTRGAELVEISALSAGSIPDIDALYIGGGFPETHAIALSQNRSFRRSLRGEVEKGLPVYAECGGLMFLGKALLLDGKRYPMAGVFPLEFSLRKRPQAHGYTIVRVSRRNPYYPVGTVLKGHEFHYSQVLPAGALSGAGFAFTMQRGQGIREKQDGIWHKNVLATYTHLHAYGAPQWADAMIRQARAHKKRRGDLSGKT
ncbi:MAG: cobyrinate a,c-diamide synthase [Nitrospirae bacterium]|nr:MAG: cobyrinate a,c-diamide synthase [Nitrospirota bacterium]